MNKKPANDPLRIALIYALFGGLWILLSDKVLELIAPTPELAMSWQTYKGWTYVAITALLVYSLVRNLSRRYSRSERLLRESSSRHSVIFERSPLGMILFTPEGMIEDCNDKLVEVLGSSRPKLLGLNVAKHAQRDMGDALRQALGGEVSVFEGSYTTITSGRTLDLRVVYNPVDPKHPPTEVIATVEDVGKRKKAERALKENEELFASLFRFSPVLATLATVDSSRFMEVNEAFCLAFGLDRSDVIGKTAKELGIWDDYTQREALMHCLAEGGLVRDYEAVFRNQDGTTWTGLVTAALLTVHNRQRVLTMVTDVSSLVQAQAVLEASEKRYATLYEIAHATNVSVNFMDLMQRVQEALQSVIRANNLYVTLIDETQGALDFIYSSDETLPSCPRIPDIHDPENRRITLLPIRDKHAVLLRKKQITAMRDKGELQVHGVIPESWLGVPLLLSGQVMGSIVIQDYHDPNAYTEQDIQLLATACDQVAWALERQRHSDTLKTLDNLFQSIPAGLFIYRFVPPDRLFLEDANPAAQRITGKRLAEWQGRDFDEIWPNTSVDDSKEQFLTPFESGTPYEVERVYYEDDTLTAFFRTRVFALPGNKLAVAFEDVTDRERAIQKLRRAKERAEMANKAKGEFLANMSHEIRTPLNGLLGMLQLLEMTEITEQQQKYLGVALDSGKGLLAVINDVLNLSQIEAGVFTLHTSPFELREVVKIVRDLFSPQVGDKGLTLDYSVDPDLPEMLLGDEGRIRQILVNLVGNALKFTAEGRIEIEVSCLYNAPTEGCRVLLSVADTGIGIPEDKVDFVFGAFTQVDGSYSRRYQGAGLGLRIVKRLVEIMDGCVAVDSTLDQGTTVHVALPLGLPDTPPRLAAITQPREVPPARILLAEDEPVNRLAAERFLEALGHHVRSADNGKEALEALGEESFDLVLMDIQMPIMDGLEATRILREEAPPEAPRLPVVAMTAHAMEGDRERFLSVGMDDYIAKPVELEALKEVLARHLAESPLHGSD